MIKFLKQAHEHDLAPINRNEVRKVQTNVDKKYNWSQENTRRKDWPRKSPQTINNGQNRATPQLSNKRIRNIAKRQKELKIG